MEKIGFDPSDSVLMKNEKQPAKESCPTRRGFCAKVAIGGAITLGALNDVIGLCDKVAKFWPTPKPVLLAGAAKSGTPTARATLSTRLHPQPLRIAVSLRQPSIVAGQTLIET